MTSSPYQGGIRVTSPPDKGDLGGWVFRQRNLRGFLAQSLSLRMTNVGFLHSLFSVPPCGASPARHSRENGNPEPKPTVHTIVCLGPETNIGFCTVSFAGMTNVGFLHSLFSVPPCGASPARHSRENGNPEPKPTIHTIVCLGPETNIGFCTASLPRQQARLARRTAQHKQPHCRLFFELYQGLKI